MEYKDIKIEFKPDKILFPKNGKINVGQFSLVGSTLVKNFDSEKEEIKLNSFGNFVIKTFISPPYNTKSSYTAIVRREKNERNES